MGPPEEKEKNVPANKTCTNNNNNNNNNIATVIVVIVIKRIVCYRVLKGALGPPGVYGEVSSLEDPARFVVEAEYSPCAGSKVVLWLWRFSSSGFRV